MKPVEFGYWLQGFFELAKPEELGEYQTTCIKKHAEMSIKYIELSSENSSPSRDFVFWTIGFLLRRSFLNKKETLILKEKLNDIFLHEIDSSYGNAEELNTIHNQASSPVIPNNPVVRC